jgi:hypothetical protein
MVVRRIVFVLSTIIAVAIFGGAVVFIRAVVIFARAVPVGAAHFCDHITNARDIVNNLHCHIEIVKLARHGGGRQQRGETQRQGAEKYLDLFHLSYSV